MAKKKKTREQKMQSDLRRQNQYMYAPQVSIGEKLTSPSPLLSPLKTHNASQAIATFDYHYLKTDLLKTVILTGSIILIELTLLFFTKGV